MYVRLKIFTFKIHYYGKRKASHRPGENICKTSILIREYYPVHIKNFSIRGKQFNKKWIKDMNRYFAK